MILLAELEAAQMTVERKLLDLRHRFAEAEVKYETAKEYRSKLTKFVEDFELDEAPSDLELEDIGVGGTLYMILNLMENSLEAKEEALRAFADEAKAAYVLNEFLVHAQIAKAQIDFESEADVSETDTINDDATGSREQTQSE